MGGLCLIFQLLVRTVVPDIRVVFIVVVGFVIDIKDVVVSK
jgi:hypothetical protein